jgi:RNA polymerase sigma-70 factor (ECF subfamily)
VPGDVEFREGNLRVRKEERREEFEHFVRDTERTLFGQAFVLCGQYQEAEDLVQETFVRAWQHWGKVASYDDPKAWARRVLHNLAVSKWRRLRHRAAGHDPTQDIEAPDVAHLDVVAALARLPVRQRRAVVLHDINDLSVAEVAGEMNAPEGSVRGWLSRGRASLADDLGVSVVPQARRA